MKSVKIRVFERNALIRVCLPSPSFHRSSSLLPSVLCALCVAISLSSHFPSSATSLYRTFSQNDTIRHIALISVSHLFWIEMNPDCYRDHRSVVWLRTSHPAAHRAWEKLHVQTDWPDPKLSLLQWFTGSDSHSRTLELIVLTNAFLSSAEQHCRAQDSDGLDRLLVTLWSISATGLHRCV